MCYLLFFILRQFIGILPPPRYTPTPPLSLTLNKTRTFKIKQKEKKKNKKNGFPVACKFPKIKILIYF